MDTVASKVVFFFLSVLFLLVGPVGADNQSPLVIGADQRWQGTIDLSQPILVAAGAKLSIAPGTRIVVSEKHFSIRVEGNLQALGSAAQPIEFVTPEGWLGIELHQSAEMNRFEHVRIAAAAIGLSSSLSRFEVRESQFINCGTAIKLHRQSTPLVENSQFSDNQLAIDIGMRSQVVLRGNRFLGNATAVMASHNSSGELTGNHFAENQQGIYLRHLFAGRVSGNIFEQNSAALLCDQTMSSPLIESNQFVGNQQGVVCLLASKPQLRRNVFRQNQQALVNNQLGSPHVEQNLFLHNALAIKNERRAAPLIERNQFENNELALFCDYLSYPTVKQNNFTGNRLAVKLGDHQSAAMEEQGASSEQMQKFLADSGRSGKMAVLAPVSGVVDVRHNWWGMELKAAAPKMFSARRQNKWVLDDTTGARYLRDQIDFSPWLQQPVADAGIN